MPHEHQTSREGLDRKCDNNNNKEILDAARVEPRTKASRRSIWITYSH